MRRLALFGATVVLTAMLAVTPYAANAARQTLTAPAAVLNPHRTNWVQSLSIDKFNTSLGDLVGVTVKYNYGLAGFVKYENLNSEAQNITFVLNGSTGIRFTGGANVGTPFAFHWDATVAAPADDGDFNWNGPGGGLAATLSETAGPRTATFSGADLNAFKGTGSLGLEAFSRFTSETVSSGSVASWYQTDTSARVEVTYEYETTVPEPGGLLAILSGLVGMVGTVMKRRS